MHAWKLSILAIGVCLLASTASLAQDITATVAGRVTDPTGALVPGANVNVSNEGTGAQRSTTTSADGFYRFTLLSPGTYSVEASREGFKAYVRRGINLSVGQTAAIDIALEVGQVSDAVTVTADTEMVEATSHALGKVIDNRRIEELPLLSRDYKELGLLIAGAAPMLKFGGEDRSGSIRGDDQGYFVNGLRSTFNSFLLDGGSNNNSNTGGAVITPTPETIKEFKMHTNSFSAEFNGASSIITVITKSGTNELHGSLFEYLRNDKLDARGFFDAGKPPLRRNQFGGTLGGPVIRDKTFFLGSYELLRVRDGVTRRLNVPSADWRSGNLASFNRALRDPQGGTFAGNIIPAGRISPIATALLDRFYALPNDPSGFFVKQQSISTDDNRLSARIDHALTLSNNLFVRYIREHRLKTDPDPSVADASQDYDTANQSAILSDTHVVSPTKVNDFRLSYLRRRYKEIADARLDHNALGLNYEIFEPIARVGPRINITGLMAVNPPLGGAGQTENTWQAYDVFAWEHGHHSTKIGGEYNWYQTRFQTSARTNGLFTFNGQLTGLGFADFLLGLPRTFDQSKFLSDRPFIGKGAGMFIQHDWRVTAKLTVNLGLRYDLVAPPVDNTFGQAVTLWPGQQSTRFPEAPTGLLYSGDPQIPKAIMATDRNNIAPRVGFAWQPLPKWTVRSGYGFFYDTKVFANYATQLAVAPPFDVRRTIDLPRSLATPIEGVQDPFNLPPGSRFSYPLPLVRTLDRDNVTPYAQHWNFSIQRQFGENYLLDAAYVGTKGTHLMRFNELNDAIYRPGATIQNAQQRRPYPMFRQIYNFQGTANSSYNALQITLTKRFSSGLSFTSAYTWSKTIDDSIGANIGGEPQFPQDSRNLRAERALSASHIPHRWANSYIWNLPALENRRGLVKWALGNWQLNGIVTLQSGDYSTVIENVDIALTGRSGQVNQRPDLVGDPNDGPKTMEQWFNVSAFRRLDPQTDVGRFGSAGRSLVHNPGRFGMDASLFKNFKPSERFTLQLRGEAFNLFNHAVWSSPVTAVDNQRFGQITGTGPGRRMQVALKLTF